MENKLILNGKEYELVETRYPDWIAHTNSKDTETYKNFGIIKTDVHWKGINVWYCKAIRIGLKMYGVKPIKTID